MLENFKFDEDLIFFFYSTPNKLVCICVSIHLSMFLATALKPGKGLWLNFIERLGIIGRYTLRNIVMVGKLQREVF